MKENVEIMQELSMYTGIVVSCTSYCLEEDVLQVGSRVK